jgi:hypothetical protein
MPLHDGHKIGPLGTALAAAYFNDRFVAFVRQLGVEPV